MVMNKQTRPLICYHFDGLAISSRQGSVRRSVEAEEKTTKKRSNRGMGRIIMTLLTSKISLSELFEFEE